MPIKIQNGLPAKEQLEHENIFVMDESRALAQDIRPLKVLIVNLMPLKENTERDLLRCLSNSPLQTDISFLQLESHISKHTSPLHMAQFYKTFGEIRKKKFDGMIITGAPVETIPFEQVDYWTEITKVMDWGETHVTSTLDICWGAQAGLYHHYGIRKELLPAKLSGVYRHRVMNRKEPLVRGFDDYFYAPHSRYTEACQRQIREDSRLKILADSREAGIYIIMAEEGKKIFVMGHPEYDRMTLHNEYVRDLAKGIGPDIPVNYYPSDNATQRPVLSWRSHANILYANWLNYYVYQITPYILTDDPGDMQEENA